MKATGSFWGPRALLVALFPAVIACGGGATGSVGAVLGKREDGRLYVREAPSGMAAATAGLEPDDEILAIDGRDVRKMTADEVRKALRGRVGSGVVLLVERKGARREVTVTRGPFQEEPR
jgi:C-terminal processing protease CtpA/Prc